MNVARRLASVLMLVALPLAVAACSGSAQSDEAAAKKEDPAEQGAAEIQRKADEAIKAKVADFDAKMKQQQQEAAVPQTPTAVSDEAGENEAPETKSSGKK